MKIYIKVIIAVNNKEDTNIIIRNIKNENPEYGNAKLYGSGSNKDITINGIHLNKTADIFVAKILINHIT